MTISERIKMGKFLDNSKHQMDSMIVVSYLSKQDCLDWFEAESKIEMQIMWKKGPELFLHISW